MSIQPSAPPAVDLPRSARTDPAPPADLRRSRRRSRRGAGRFAASSRLSSFSQKMSRLGLVAFHKSVVGEGLEAFGLFAFVPILGVVAGTKSSRSSRFSGFVFSVKCSFVPEVVNPDRFRPWLLAGRFAVEEKDVRLHALGVKDPSGQAQQRMDIALLQKTPTDRLSRATFKEHVVRHKDRRSFRRISRYRALHAAEKLSCLLLVVAQKSSRAIREPLALFIAVFAYEGNAGLLTKRRIRQHHRGTHANLC